MKAEHCDECRHGRPYDSFEYSEGIITVGMACARGHVPRFYAPRDMRDVAWGWKRRCSDFEPRWVADDDPATEAALKTVIAELKSCPP